ncbi:MAG: SDR family NAD(P)-dependent oxidoreductase [Chloroflexota bacterium]
MLNGKIVFVSGGTGYIGSEICRNFHELGAKVIFSYNRNKEKADLLADELKGVCSIEINMRNVEDMQKKIESIYKNFGNIDVLVNNAAIAQIMPLAMLEEEDVDLVFDINLKGTLFLTQSAVRGMIRQKKGAIVNLGSIAGHRMLDVPVTYAITKSAYSGMTLALASELKKFNIRVNNVIPGMMEGGVSNGIPEDLKETFNRHNATGRSGKAREVSELVCFLASDKASYINGQNIFVDGGF